MGIFDRWRRKRIVTETPARPPTPISELSPEVQDEIVDLVARYERLVARREELQQERSDLTTKLDRGELTPIEFRKQLMAKIQEAAQVSENLRVTAARLTALGYRGVLR